MTAFLEQPFSYEKKQDDFYLIQHIAPVISDYCSTFDEGTIISHMRHRMFNSTSTNFPLPENIISEMTQDSNLASFCKQLNSWDTSDPFSYRQQRSEQLLFRMICLQKIDLSQISLMRLSKGIFVHQVWQSSSPQSSPTLSSININLSMIEEAPVDNFHFRNINQAQNSCYDMFVPFSYTFGVRYTNPYTNTSDIIVRGKIPVWAQTLFLSTCLSSIIHTHSPIAGLFPFAPYIQVSFSKFNQISNVSPDLTLDYERLTNEYDDPHSLPGESHWPSCKRRILDNILICDIPDSIASHLESMANIWAANQGLF